MPVHWDGSMISPTEDFDGAPVLRKDIALQTGHGDLRSAELHVSLGDGWFRGRLTWSGARALYGDRLGVIGQLEIGYADGLARSCSVTRPGPRDPQPSSPTTCTTGRRSTPAGSTTPGPYPAPHPPGGSTSRPWSSTPACSRRTSVHR
jgi:hypothetical protein